MLCIFIIIYFVFGTEDVRSLSLPGTYNEKIGCLGDSLRKFSRLKSLDLSRNAIENLAVSSGRYKLRRLLLLHRGLKLSSKC